MSNNPEDNEYYNVEKQSSNPSARPVKKTTFDNGSDDRETTERKVLEYLEKRKGNALLHTLIEDACYTIFEGAEEDLKMIAIELLGEMTENSELEYYHNGKRTALKVEVEI
jgi:hypothetical protein